MTDDKKPLSLSVHPEGSRTLLEEIKFYFYLLGIGRKSLSKENFEKIYILKDNVMGILSVEKEKEITIIFITKDFQQNIVLTEEFLKQSNLPTRPFIKALKSVWKKQYNEDLNIE